MQPQRAMKSGMIRAFVLATVLLSAAPCALASDYGELLKRADAVRSSDPELFETLMSRLQARAGEATPADLHYLQLLKAYHSARQGDYTAATQSAIALEAGAPEPEVRFRAGLLVANVAAITRDFSLGLRYLERALALQESVREPATRELGEIVAATLYNQFGQYGLGLTHAERLLAGQPSARGRCFGRMLHAEALQGLGRPIDESRDLLDAIGFCTAQREPIEENLLRSILAQRWASDGKRHQALTLLKTPLAEVRATGYTRLIGEIESLLARYSLEEGDTVAARDYARGVIERPGHDELALPSVTARHVLYTIALDSRNFPEALAQYRLYAEADKARLDDVKAREYAFQLSRHELNQKNQSIALLQSQNRLLQLRQQAARASAWNFRLAIALLAVLTGSFAYWAWRARRTHGSLRQLADTDGLTGLANRRHFRASSEAVLAQCAQRQRPVAVLLFDLDHFKQINDQCGHSSGDWVLREVARVGRLHCREQDIFGRIGGEEFAMTLVDCEIHDALGIAEACRRAIASIDARTCGCSMPVAASIGVVGTRQAGYDYEALIAHADAAMYRAKVGGRNRVTLYEPPAVPAAGQPVMLDRRNAESMLRQY
jgi:diguanylate cyclase (GGDEF)-like protein